MVIVNDARTVIIAGLPAECKQVAKKLGAQMNEIPQGMVGHCDFVKPHCGAIQYVHDMLSVPNLQEGRSGLVHWCWRRKANACGIWQGSR